MKLALVLCALLLLAPHSVAAADAPIGTLQPATYLRTTDGDTIVVALAAVETKIRLTGVEAPELEGTAAGFESAAFTARACEEAVTIWVEVDEAKPKDRYGRTLAWIWLSSGSADMPVGLSASSDLILLNRAIIDSGHALIYPSDEARRYFEWK